MPETIRPSSGAKGYSVIPLLQTLLLQLLLLEDRPGHLSLLLPIILGGLHYLSGEVANVLGTLDHQRMFITVYGLVSAQGDRIGGTAHLH